MDIRRLTLHQLRVFLAVVRRRSFTRAAEDLLISQSAVSAQIRELTGLLGVPLFDQIGKKIFAVRVGGSTSIGTYFLPSLIAGFTARHSGIEVSLEIENTAHIEDRLLRNDFDVGFVGGAQASQEFEAEPFLEDEIFFACAPSHRLASSRSLDSWAPPPAKPRPSR